MTSPAYRINAQPCTSQAFYAAACDPERQVVVQACAGAGKTWMLVSRMLRALVEGAAGKEILAITFTRKAAGEMQARLQEWLAAYSHGVATHAERVEALQVRGMSAAQAQAMAQPLGELQERMLRAGDSVRVRTFHGWFADLVGQLPLDVRLGLGLAPTLKLMENVLPLQPQLAQRFMAQVAASAPLQATYSRLVLCHGRFNVDKWLAASTAKSVEIERADAAGHLEPSVPAPAVLWPDIAPGDVRGHLRVGALRALVEQALHELHTAKGVKARAAGQALMQALDQEDDAALWQAVLEALFTDDGCGTPRKLATKADQFVAVPALVHAVEQLKPAVLQQQARADHLDMCQLVRVWLAEFKRLKQQQGLLDMNDLEQAAHAVLQDPVLSARVHERLDWRIRHLLIDEFQDTSPLQWQAVHSWLAGYAGAGAGQAMSVFIVGDGKQSIYRFRRAEPRVFAAARAFMAEGLGAALLECDHTRRNAPQVVDVINRVFDRVEATQTWQPYRPHTTASQADGLVQAVEPIARSLKVKVEPDNTWRDTLQTPRLQPKPVAIAAQMRQVVRWLQERFAQGGAMPGEVMVLARRRAPLHALAAELTRAQVPHQPVKADSLLEAPSVKDLLAVMEVLVSPGHDAALGRALRSPVFGVGDAELLKIAAWAREADRPWLEGLMTLAQDPTSTTAEIDNAAACFARWRNGMQWRAPHDLLDQIVHESDFLAHLSVALPAERREPAQRAVQSLLAAALDLDGGRYLTHYGFLRALRRQAAGVAVVGSADAVQLLTVHGAKGLEANVVLVIDSDPHPLPAERQAVLVDWPVESQSPRRVAFLASESRVPPSLEALISSEAAANRCEDLNGLYVAMTRARRQLVFFSTPPRNATVEPSWWRWLCEEVPLTPVPDAVLAAQGQAPVPWVPFVPQVARGEAGNALAMPMGMNTNTLAAARGRALHRALEWLARRGAPHPLSTAQGTQACARAVQSEGLPVAEAARVAEQVAAILASPDCTVFFGATVQWEGNEVPLAVQGKPLRADRLVALSEPAGLHWWVLDYKLATQPEGVASLRAQLTQYRDALRDLVAPGEQVSAAFITARGELRPL
jgi:ATP-dependent helicase/nuclease subunit A